MRKPAALFLFVLPLLAAPLQAQNLQTAPLPGHTHNNLAFRRELAPAIPASPTQEGHTAPASDCLIFSPTLDDALAQHLQAYPSLAVTPPEFVLRFPTEGATHPALCGTEP